MLNIIFGILQWKIIVSFPSIPTFILTEWQWIGVRTVSTVVSLGRLLLIIIRMLTFTRCEVTQQAKLNA